MIQSVDFNLWWTMVIEKYQFFPFIRIFVFEKKSKVLIVFTYLDIQIRVFPKLPPLFFLEKSQSITFYLAKNFVKIFCRMFDQSF